ncbi:transcriptional repressor [Pseudomonas sp. G11-1]|jgi:Fur family transcriptional regulator, zinc uptake regulator|uniref:Ferric uptake regulation protein n=1 Tax=Halopseudomonas bauzanensis TaxID=653930 RepID=A0A031MDH3_9GAMM|nr:MULTISPECIES: Fur family transcriptional regulator [Halopseudomonas]MCO5786919.1 transcriptional repressor [Pseudomonas sp. G11-1]MCO5790145.1 transcriptional repressor [Pseudomonas sp. G11-2]EZQ18045.1 Fur family transcriptional regulator [Halopseudomonas bauzanensis]WGK61718.1 Fur family transcriptional regulator [Halopseudomonas sp. SMJS2]SER87925.1 Fur family transcriptional regulator, zinc uptake regulator [Halopseudomonas bauzanensis]
MNKFVLPEHPHCPHDHSQCVSDALSAAEQVCERAGARLTALRKRVLELVWQSHRPLGAYDLLETLAREDDRRPAPPTVYRALDFLQEQGLVHRIASLNAFIGCASPEHTHQGHFLICRNCRVAIELDQSLIHPAIAKVADQMDFSVEAETVEIAGLCSQCREAA